MNRRDKKVYDIIDKITKEYNALSDEAKEFIASTIEENDVVDYLRAMVLYQRVLKERLYIEDTDEADDAIIETMKTLIKYFIEYVDEFSIYY